jgi:serine/threonine protein kinase
LLGKYRIDELIGSGGMGNVVRASHLYLHQPVAIKILLPQVSEDPSTVQRFLREAQATVKLKSEHSARVMDVGTGPDGTPFMVMEFLEGSDLHQILRHHGRQPPAVAVDLMLQACEGLAEAHALGIIHRDIKPSNFFITRRPDGSPLLKILDFGISKALVGNHDLTGTQTVLGTPTYMAPEQMKSGRSADPRSDIWSMGVVTYQLLTGYPPFAGETYADLVLKVGLELPAPITVPLPTGLPEAVLHCLEKDAAARYANVGELARAIAPFATDSISAMQTAARVMRILAQRGAPPPMTMGPGSGLSSPIPLSPAQLTPNSWSPSQVTSLSQGIGQVTHRARASRGWLIGSIMGLCVLAGVGGYAISQMSKPDGGGRNEPHVLAPLPTVQPAPLPAAPVAKPEPVAAPTPVAPSVVEAPAAVPSPAEATAPEPRAQPALIDANPAAKKPAVEPRRPQAKPPAKPAVEAKPPAKPAVEAKPPAKPKKDKDLFESRH